MSTSLSVAQVRSGVVLEEVRAHPELIRSVEDIAELPRFKRWIPTYLEDAISELVFDGALTEAADGALCVRSTHAPATDAGDHTREHHRALVLCMLRAAGRRGLSRIAIRDAINGHDPNEVLEDLRACGYDVERALNRHGVVAVLRAEQAKSA